MEYCFLLPDHNLYLPAMNCYLGTAQIDLLKCWEVLLENRNVVVFVANFLINERKVQQPTSKNNFHDSREMGSSFDDFAI